MVAAKEPSRVLECEGNPVRDHRGSAEMVILVCRDITARVRADDRGSLEGAPGM
jgi:hypothetical protein